MEADAGDSLRQITERLEQLAGELADATDEERTAELVREASKLAAEAGEEVERVLRRGTDPSGGPDGPAGPAQPGESADEGGTGNA